MSDGRKVWIHACVEVSDADIDRESPHHETRTQAIQALLETGRYSDIELLDFQLTRPK